MSSVFKRSGSWYLRYKTAAGAWTQEVTGARTREEAKRLAAELELKHERIRRGTEVEPGDPTLTFGALFAWWEENHVPRLAKSTADIKVPALKKHVLSRLQALVLREVTSQRLELLFDEIEKDLAGSTVNGLRSMLHAIFAKASKRGLWVGTNPVAATDRRKETKRDFESLDVDEVPKLLEQLDEHWRPLFATAIYTGMRKGELGGLHRDDVDLRAGIITVRRSWDAKTTKGRKVAPVPIAAPLKPYIEQALRAHKADRVFPDLVPDTKLHDVLRRALSRGGLARAWVHVCRRTRPTRCGFEERRADNVSLPCPKCGFRLWPKPVHREIRFHDLRATTATLLARSGAGLAVAQRVLRHSDPSLTSNIYTRVSLEQMREALDVIVPSMAPKEEPQQAEPQRAVANGDELAAPVLHAAEVHRAEAGTVSQPVALAEDFYVGPGGFEPPTPTVSMRAGERARGCTAGPAMNSVPVQALRRPPAESGVRRSSPFTVGLAAPVLHSARAPLLTVRQVAQQLAVSTATVYALVERQELAHVRVSNAIRVEEGVLQAFIAARRS